MKDYFFALLLCAILGTGIKCILPKGDQSPFLPPLQFILSLLMIGIVLHPFASLIKNKDQADLSFSLPQWEADVSAEEIIFNKTEERMRETVKRAFPEEEISLSLIAGEEGIPIGIQVTCSENAKEKVISFLETNYGLAVFSKGSDA